ncbi:MAG: CDC27 family protein [Myxococcales bacterium]|nr:CDC27 family protein [Polyangiaceae bacterium]MDW8250262.1 CDC27 family protein [Myxococcales bacterium]
MARMSLEICARPTPLTLHRPQAPGFHWLSSSPSSELVQAIHQITSSASLPPVVADHPSEPSTPSTLVPVALDPHQPSAHFPLPPLPQLPSMEEYDDPSADFFRAGNFCLPAEPPLEEEPTTPAPEPPELVERRLFFRKAVSALLGMAAPLLLAIGVKSLTTRPTPPEAFTAAAAQQLSLLAEAQATSHPVLQATIVPSASSSAVESTPPPVSATSSAAPPSAPPPEPTIGADLRPNPAQAQELTRQALSLLERGSYKAALEKATASMDADPTDASPYLYAGTALMELGKYKEAKILFARCVENATRGPKYECKQFR